MTHVTMLGLGAMGSRMALSLLNKGHQVTVYNRTAAHAEPLRAAGAAIANSPREAAEASDIIISMVRDDDASRALWLGSEGALLGLKPEAVAIESSTLTAGWVSELESAVRTKNAHFLAAPVVGSRPQADAGQLIYLVGGEESAFTRAQPVLADMGAAVHHVGEAKSAVLLKLAANALFGVQVVAVAELLALLRRSGLEAKKAVDILGSLPMMSPAAKGAAGLILAHKFDPLFPIGLVEKDLRYTLAEGEKVQASLPTTTAAHVLFQQAGEAGLSDENIVAVSKLFEKQQGK